MDTATVLNDFTIRGILQRPIPGVGVAEKRYTRIWRRPLATE